jgi:sigma-B regulation protein RsbU (phosphoserine phosphatase)
LLAIIDREICDTSARGMFVTMVAGTFDPRTGNVRLANAGHEPPLLERRDGSFAEFPAMVPPVGLGIPGATADPFPEHDIDLAGGTLYLFTDGLTEAAGARSGMAGGDHVRQLIAAARSQPLPLRLQSIAAQAGAGPLRDDLTILAVGGAGDMAPDMIGCGATPDRLLSLRFLAQPDRLKGVRAAVREAMVRTGCSDACAQDIVMAVDEACQNIIRHGYRDNPAGEIVLDLDRVEDHVVLWLRDFAPKVDEKKIKPRDLDQIRPGGLGVHFIREAMDEARFVPCAAGNILRMVKRLG